MTIHSSTTAEVSSNLQLIGIIFVIDRQYGNYYLGERSAGKEPSVIAQSNDSPNAQIAVSKVNTNNVSIKISETYRENDIDVYYLSVI